MRKLIMSAGVCCVCVSTAAAGGIDGPDAGKENWDGSLELSASAASGNTDNTVIGARFDTRRVLGRYTHDIKAGADYTETTNEVDGEDVTETTQNKWFTQYRLEMQMADKTFSYARARYEQDEFSGYDQRAFLGGGIGHSPFDRDEVRWSLLAGPGVQYTQFVEPDSPDPEFKREETEIAAFFGSDLHWLLRENITLEHVADATWTEKNSTLESRVALTSKLTETISTRVSYNVKHETDPAEDREATDTQLKASVVFGF